MDWEVIFFVFIIIIITYSLEGMMGLGCNLGISFYVPRHPGLI